MDWYYVADNKSIGPIDDQQFGQLVGSGNIRAETLVWREGMANWLPYRQAVAPSSAFPLPASGPISSQITPVADQVLCLECRRAVPREETIQYGADYICAACKPAFIQRLREGADAPSTMIYGGFWLRFLAKIIDGLALSVLFLPLLGLFIFTTRSTPQTFSLARLGFQLILQLAYWALMVAYTTFFHGKYGATLGKMACGLKVVTPEGEPLTYTRAVGRGFSELVSGWICYVGYILAGFDEQKRALHDHMASTRVIRVR